MTSAIPETKGNPNSFLALAINADGSNRIGKLNNEYLASGLIDIAMQATHAAQGATEPVETNSQHEAQGATEPVETNSQHAAQGATEPVETNSQHEAQRATEPVETNSEEVEEDMAKNLAEVAKQYKLSTSSIVEQSGSGLQSRKPNNEVKEIWAAMERERRYRTILNNEMIRSMEALNKKASKASEIMSKMKHPELSIITISEFKGEKYHKLFSKLLGDHWNCSDVNYELFTAVNTNVWEVLISPGSKDKASSSSKDKASSSSKDKASPGSKDKASPSSKDNASPSSKDNASSSSKVKTSPSPKDKASSSQENRFQFWKLKKLKESGLATYNGNEMVLCYFSVHLPHNSDTEKQDIYGQLKAAIENNCTDADLVMIGGDWNMTPQEIKDQFKDLKIPIDKSKLAFTEGYTNKAKTAVIDNFGLISQKQRYRASFGATRIMNEMQDEQYTTHAPIWAEVQLPALKATDQNETQPEGEGEEGDLSRLTDKLNSVKL